MNSSVLSWFPSNGSGLVALALWIGLCEVWMGMLAWGFTTIACATVDAVAEATLVMSLLMGLCYERDALQLLFQLMYMTGYL